MIPSTLTQLLATLVFVVPGFVYQAVRISVRGRLPLDIELSTRIVRAIVSSVIFGLVYLLIAGECLVDAAQGTGLMYDHPRVGALFGLAGGIVIPAAAGLARLPDAEWLSRLASRLPEISRYDPTPTGWDKAFQNSSECFVRVLNQDSQWIAGYYGANSYATSYPENQQIFLERAHHITSNGVIEGEIEGSKGCLIDCGQIQLLELLESGSAEDMSSGSPRMEDADD